MIRRIGQVNNNNDSELKDECAIKRLLLQFLSVALASSMLDLAPILCQDSGATIGYIWLYTPSRINNICRSTASFSRQWV